MPSGLRLQRIADSIRQEISEMLIREISDPRLKLISITDVKVDKELAFADVYVSACGRTHAFCGNIGGIGIGQRIPAPDIGKPNRTARLSASPLSLGSDAGECRSH